MKPKIIQVTAIGMSQIKLLSRLNKSLVDEGFEVHAVCSSDEYTNLLSNDGVIFHDVNIDRSINPLGNLKSIMRMVKVFKKVQPDIVHVHTPVAAVLGRIAAKIANVPTVIYTAHGFYFHEGMSKLTYQTFYLIEKYIGKFFTDYIFTQSKEDFDLAINGKFLKNNNYLHISNGIDLENQFNYYAIDDVRINKIKNELGIKDDEIVFSFLGRMVKEKGIIELLESFSILSEENPNIKLLCMGSMPTSERDNSVNELIKKFKDNKQIIFLGQVENSEIYYKISDVFVLPSYREGMPRSIIEAMSMKNAIIATNIRGSREEVVPRETGYLVKVNDVSSLLEAMRYLSDNPSKIMSMKELGYQRALSEYNERDVVSKQLKVFKKVLESRDNETTL